MPGCQLATPQSFQTLATEEAKFDKKEQKYKEAKRKLLTEQRESKQRLEKGRKEMMERHERELHRHKVAEDDNQYFTRKH